MQDGEKIRLLILGSCVSRDIFGISEAPDFEIADYFARTSLAALTAPPTPDPMLLERLESPFQRRIVGRDLDKSFWQALENQSFDFLLLDFIDDRFDLLPRAGGLVTLSSEFIRAAGQPDRALRIDSIGAEKRRLWRLGWQRLLKDLDRLGLRHRVIVNRVRWADQDLNGQTLLRPDPATRAAQNDLLEWLYEQVAQDLPEAGWLSYSETLLLADPNHKWGLSPFHYGRGFYDEAARQLRVVAAARTATLNSPQLPERQS